MIQDNEKNEIKRMTKVESESASAPRQSTNEQVWWDLDKGQNDGQAKGVRVPIKDDARRPGGEGPEDKEQR